MTPKSAPLSALSAKSAVKNPLLAVPCECDRLLKSNMNVTLKLPDELVREARHLALDENTTLSTLVMELLSKKLEGKTNLKIPPSSWIDAFSGASDDEFLDREFPLEDRKALPNREFSFQPGEE